MKPKRAKTPVAYVTYTRFEQCLLCKKLVEDVVPVHISDCLERRNAYTSDGELVCDSCCEWLKEEGRKVNEL